MSKGKISLILGVASVILLLLPLVIIFLSSYLTFLDKIPLIISECMHWICLITSIGAIIFGVIATKDKKDKSASIGTALGLIILVLLIILLTTEVPIS